MSDFHAALRAVHGEMWETGADQGRDLQLLLDRLSDQPLPVGVRRLPSARMTLGPHLAPQLDGAPADGSVTWLDALREPSVARKRTSGV
jgi:hypothetical protein